MDKKFFFILTSIFFVMLLSNFSYADSDRPQINITLLDYSPNPVQPGQVIDVILQLDNFEAPTKQASLEIVEEYPFTVENSQDVEVAKNLGRVSYSRKLQFRIRIAEDAKDGLTTLRVRYSDDDYDGGFLEEEFDINIQTFDARLSIIKVEQVPKRIIPGEQGKLILTIQNSDDKPLKNLDVILDLTHSFDFNSIMDNMVSMQALVNARLEEVDRRVASGLSPLKGATPMMSGTGMEQAGTFSFKAFSPVESSNQKGINEIKSGQKIKMEFDIMALPDASPNIYATPLYLSYNDEDNNPFHLRVDIPLVIDSEPELYVDMKSTNLRTTDFAAEVVFTVANRGLSELRYVTLELADDDTLTLLTAPRSLYIGNLGPGESKEGAYTILANEENIILPVRAAYRDSFNKEFELTKKIPFTVINRNFYRDLPYEMWITWLILGLVILVLTGFYVKQMANKKSE
jgi:hypothetical protein